MCYDASQVISSSEMYADRYLCVYSINIIPQTVKC